MMMRGDIHYVMETGSHTGSEQYAGRPAIIVSNDMCNAHSPVAEVVFLTTRPKTDLPTHVTIRSTTKTSIALCEQITSVSVERLGSYAGTCTEQEMSAIDTALRVSLALNLESAPSKVSEVRPASTDVKLIEDLRTQLRQALTEKEMYKTMYNELIGSILDRRS